MTKIILLGFDDEHILEWSQAADLMKHYGIKATFYISGVLGLSPLKWKILKRLREAGHEIAFHGVNHLRAGVVCDPEKPEIYKKKNVHSIRNWDEFLAKEITPGLIKFREMGFVINHYSYPMGNRNDESDRVLLKYFKTLRRGGCGLYSLASFPRVYGALNHGRRPGQPWSGHEGLLSRARAGEVVSLFMHEPVMHRIEWLGKTGRRNGFTFRTIENIAGN